MENVIKEMERKSVSDKNTAREDPHISKKRRQVIQYFKQDGVNNAAYAYRLWPDKEESNARSQFTKCLYGKLNDEGFPYSFTNSEINHLYSMISSASLNEGVIRMTENEFKAFIKSVVNEAIKNKKSGK